MKADPVKFCYYCGEVKAPWFFNSTNRCSDCKRKANHAQSVGLPIPGPIWPVKSRKQAKNKNQTQELTRADKARICELSFGFCVPINLIAEIEQVSRFSVSKTITQYLGTGLPPVTMTISADNDQPTQ